MSYTPPDIPQKTAFGEISTASPRPIVQLQWPYNIHAEIVETRVNGGAVSVDSKMLKLSTGAGANQSAQMTSKLPIKYNPGQGGLTRFTAIFTSGAANSTQLWGFGDNGDGYFFGYNGTAFGVMRRRGGNSEIQSLTITTKSTTAEDITITLDSDAQTTIAVTDATSGDVTTTANDIASSANQAKFAALGKGWVAHVEGDTVLFISFDAAAKSGTMSLTSATTAVGSFAETLNGAAPTDTWVAQTVWSEDKAAGSETLPSMDFTKGNIFDIRYQWLGFGVISFYVTNPSDGVAILVHKIKYANANTVPSINNPTLPLCGFVGNAANTSDIIGRSGSMAGFVEGEKIEPSVRHSVTGTQTSTTTEVPILSLHNRLVHQSVFNRVVVNLSFVGVATTGGAKGVIIRFKTGVTLTGASFSDVDTANSVVQSDTSATAMTGGSELFDIVHAGETPLIIPLNDTDVYLVHGEVLTVSIQQVSAGTASEVTVSVNFLEDF